jgi:hypothetical protein
MTLRTIAFLFRHRRACKRRLVDQQRESFEVRDYSKRRAAALKHTRAPA